MRWGTDFLERTAADKPMAGCN